MPVTSPGTLYCFLWRLGHGENERMNAESAWQILKHHVTLTNTYYYVKWVIHGIGWALSYSFYFSTVCFFPLLSSYIAPRPSSNKHCNLSFLYNLSQLPRYTGCHENKESTILYTIIDQSQDAGCPCKGCDFLQLRPSSNGSTAEAGRTFSFSCLRWNENVTCHMHHF